MRSRRSDDSDSESYTNEMSPTDGYFSPRDHPREYYIESSKVASHQSSGSDNATRTADRYTPVSSSSGMAPLTPSSINEPNEITPLLIEGSGNAPPPYTDATETYSNGRETWPYLAQIRGERSREPQWMSASVEAGGVEDHEYQKPPRRWQNGYGCCGSRSRVFKGALMLFAALLGAWLVAVVTGRYDTPPAGGFIVLPNQCRRAETYRTESFAFSSLNDFEFMEKLDGHGHVHRHPSIYGDINIVPAPSDQKSAIVVDTSISKTADISIKSISLDKTETALRLTGIVYDDDDNSSPTSCLLIRVTIYVQESLSMDKFNVTATHLNVQIPEPLELVVNDVTVISLVLGSVHAAPFASRQTIIDVTTGAVKGVYNLLDLLSISSRTGSISVDVIPKEEDENHPSPAQFVVHSGTGSIDVLFPKADLPERDYHTNINSNTGRLHGTLVHGSITNINTRTASIDVTLIPYSPDTLSSGLYTESRTGSTRVTLLPSYKDPLKPIQHLKSSHETTTGSIHLQYPNQWEGNLTAKTMTGSISATGKDLEITREHSGWVSKYLEAKKGKGPLGGKLSISTTTGSLSVQVGDL